LGEQCARRRIGTLSHGRKSRQVGITALTPEQARPVLRAVPAEVPVAVGFLKRTGLMRKGTAEEVEALAGRCAVFRFDPLPTANARMPPGLLLCTYRLGRRWKL
jgi:hypothetical protein